MTHDRREALRSEVMATDWPDLAPHFARGALLVATPALDLLDVSVAIAEDDTESVHRWLADGTLRRANEADAEAWSEESPRFQIVILQPWVLAQCIPR